ncbi:hypothetical protein BJV74DRAFT_381289 [Russula compacta]|nr:hypothetical protein BJV74DRAFT_381289 [Russula compacta]
MSRRHANREKPKLWEARVSPAEDDRWEAIVPVSALPISSGQQANAASAEDVDPNMNPNGGEGQAAAVPAAPLPQPTPSPRHPLHRRPWLRSPFSRRRAASSPLGPVPPIPEPIDRSGLLQGQNAPSYVHDQLRVTVLIAMPDPRRPHQDGTALASPSKGKERSLDLDYDEDDLPDIALGMTELQYTDAIATPKLP